MVELTLEQKQSIEREQNRLFAIAAGSDIGLDLHDDFNKYTAIRHRHGDRHLNQAFDPKQVKLGRDDFWVLAQNARKEAIATYCLRRFLVKDFFKLIGSLALWFANPLHRQHPRFAVACQIPPFGGEVVHGGGLWIRDDYRGSSRLAIVLPHFARAFALISRPFDHDTAMIRNDPADRTELAERKAIFMGRKVYGFARVHRFVDGWFPPEGRNAIMHLCHSTQAEAIASLLASRGDRKRLRYCGEFGELPLVDQHYQSIHPTTVLSKRQQQPSI